MYSPQLETFVHVVQAGSFNKAAQEMFISSTAVTKQIKLLESRLGVQLFYRSHVGLTLTDAGKSLYEDALEVIQRCKKAMLKAKKLDEQAAHTIRIGLHSMNSVQFLIDAWPEISCFVPNLQPKLISFDKLIDYEDDLGRTLDVVPVVYTPEQLLDKRYSIFPLGNVPVRLAVSITSPLAQKEVLTGEDIVGHEILMYQRGYCKAFDRIRDLLQGMYGDRVHIHELTQNDQDYGAVNDLLEAGALVVTIDYWRHTHMFQKLLPVDWQFTVPVGLLTSACRSKNVQSFLDAVGKVFGPCK